MRDRTIDGPADGRMAGRRGTKSPARDVGDDLTFGAAGAGADADGRDLQALQIDSASCSGTAQDTEKALALTASASASRASGGVAGLALHADLPIWWMACGVRPMRPMTAAGLDHGPTSADRCPPRS
jgi:hypothetical protein